MAIKSYKNAETRDIAENVSSKVARRLLPLELHENARRRLAALSAMSDLAELFVFRGWRLELLKGDRAGQYSIRINDRYRICFMWDGTDAEEVETIDYH